MEHESILDEVNAAIEAMDWIVPADGGVIAMARHYAAKIDDVNNDPDATPQDKVKASYLGPHVIGALRELGGSPLSRGDLDQSKTASLTPAQKRLAEMRKNNQK